MSDQLPPCRVCNGPPQIVQGDIIPDYPSYAIVCPNTDCHNDTHWQNSVTKAEELWRANPCRDMRGGQGEPTDDFKSRTTH